MYAVDDGWDFCSLNEIDYISNENKILERSELKFDSIICQLDTTNILGITKKFELF